MRKTLNLITTFSLYFVLCGAAIAENSKDLSASFNPEIFSLSKKKENAFDAPSATYVLGSEEIRRSGATSIPEALRLVPGLQVARVNGNKWAISARGFNSEYSNKLLVMIDGRIIYTPVFSGVFWDIQDYVLEDIDRIEVVRGPGGTIWGANAVNGVINIITKNAAQTQGVYLSQIVGNQDKSITEARFGGKTASNDNYRLYVKKAVRDGLEQTKRSTFSGSNLSNDDGMKQDRAGFRYDISSIKDNSISLYGDMYSGKAYNYFNSTSLTNPDQNNKESHGTNFVFNLDHKLSNKSNFTLNTYIDYDQFNIPILQRSAKTYDIDFQHFYNFSKENQFIWGLGYRRVDDKITEGTLRNGTIPLDYSPSTMSSHIYSGFVQEKFGIIADKLYLTIGSKFLNNNFTGFEYQPNAKLAYYPSRNQTLWASASRAVRTPTRGENGLSISTNATTGNGIQKGNSNYQSEDVMAYELGYRVKPSNKVSIDASTFFNQYTNLRTFELDPVTSGPRYKRTISNKGYGNSYGFELSAKWQVINTWRLEASYDYLKMSIHTKTDSTDNIPSSASANNSSIGVMQGQSPRNQIKLKSFYNITPKIEFDNIIYYVERLPLGNAYATGNSGTTANTGPAYRIPGYVRFDTRIGYLPTRNLDLSVGIQDLLDQTHSEFKAGLLNQQTQVGRTIYGKMVWQY